MVRKIKMEECAEVITCEFYNLQKEMNNLIQKMNEKNWHVKDHNFVISDWGSFDTICTIIFEREVSQ